MSDLQDRQNPNLARRVPMSLSGGLGEAATSAPPVTAHHSRAAQKPNETRGTQTETNMGFLVAMLGQMTQAQREDYTRNKENDIFQLYAFGINRQQLEQQGELKQSDIFNASQDEDTQNLQVGVYIDPQSGMPRYFVGSALGPAQSYGNAGNDSWRMTNIGEIQRDMVSGIENAARVTGVPAALLGAMAGIESGFGRNQMSPTGAEGIFQQTDGYLRQWYINNARITIPALRNLNDPQVNSMLEGGISMNEARRLAYNPAASALITALAAKDMAQDLGVNLNDRGNWWMVYAEHNVGRGGLNAIRRGGEPAQWIQDANPLFYRGGGSPAARYADHIERFAGRFERSFGHMLDDDGPAARTVASSRDNGPSVRATSLASTSPRAIATNNEGGFINNTFRSWTGIDLGLNI